MIGFLLVGIIYTILAFCVDSPALPGINRIIKELISGNTNTVILQDIIASFGTAIVGIVMSWVIGFAVGLAMFVSRVIAGVAYPVINILRQVAALALMPIFIILFGLEQHTRIAIIMWTALPVMILGTYNSLKSVDKSIIEAARMDGAGVCSTIIVILPSATTGVLSSASIAVSNGWISIVAAEMLGGSCGLGFRVIQSAQVFRYEQTIVAIICISALGYILVRIIDQVKRRLFYEEIDSLSIVGIRGSIRGECRRKD